jgi:hypothetical protein
MPSSKITFYTILYHSNSGISQLEFFTLWALSMNLCLKMSSNTLIQHQFQQQGLTVALPVRPICVMIKIGGTVTCVTLGIAVQDLYFYALLQIYMFSLTSYYDFHVIHPVGLEFNDQKLMILPSE